MQGKCVLWDLPATLNAFGLQASDVKEALTGRQPKISTLFFSFSMSYLIIVLVGLCVDVC